MGIVERLKRWFGYYPDDYIELTIHHTKEAAVEIERLMGVVIQAQYDCECALRGIERLREALKKNADLKSDWPR